MASTRLTHAMRESAVKAAMAHRFDKEEAALCSDAHAFGLRVFAHFAGDDLPKIKKLPARWFRHRETIYFDVPGIRSPFDTGHSFATGGRGMILLSEGRTAWRWSALLESPTPVPFWFEDKTLEIPRISDLWSEAEALAQRADKLRTAMNETQAKLSGTLNAFTTVEKLVAAWPEIAPFLPSKAAPAAVPALPLVELNKLLGLP